MGHWRNWWILSILFFAIVLTNCEDLRNNTVQCFCTARTCADPLCHAEWCIVGFKSNDQPDLISLCRSSTMGQSCGQCIKKNPQCVWCTDPAFSGDYRCDVESNLIDSCPPQFLFQAKSNVQVTENIEAGTMDQQQGRIRQIQPQVVHALIKPGETVTFPLKYYHLAQEDGDLYVLNSETQSHGVTLTYSVDCKGIPKHGPECKGVRNADLIVYNISVTMQGCNPNAVVSIGLAHIRDVLALYVHPQCGCDCEKPEKQEPKSGHCNWQGTLVCGACNCDDERKGGRHCDCDLQPGQTTVQLEEKCRQDHSKPLCSGHGYCSCGTCQCESQYSGQFCECSYAPCPNGGPNHQACGGRGRCNCGQCECDPGWSGVACTCSTEVDDCLSSDNKLCSGRGTCQCNKCKCLDDYIGDRCELGTEDAFTQYPPTVARSSDGDQSPGFPDVNYGQHGQDGHGPTGQHGDHNPHEDGRQVQPTHEYDPTEDPDDRLDGHDPDDIDQGPDPGGDHGPFLQPQQEQYPEEPTTPAPRVDQPVENHPDTESDQDHHAMDHPQPTEATGTRDLEPTAEPQKEASSTQSKSSLFRIDITLCIFTIFLAFLRQR